MSAMDDDANNPERGSFDWNRFGRIVKHYRATHGMTLEQFNLATHVPLTALSNMERGRAASVENLLAICVYINANPCKLHSKYQKPLSATPSPADMDATSLLGPSKSITNS